MQETKTMGYVHFQSIGKTDHLQTVSCYANKPHKVKYSCQPQHFYQQKEKLICNVDEEHEKIRNLPKFKRAQDQNKERKRQYFSQSHKETHQSKKRFWPTDLIQDETGQTLQRLRSYVQTHKINTYIKHDLASNVNKQRNQNNVHISPIQLQENRKIVKNSQTDSKRNFSQNQKHKNKFIKIDYQVITITKQCKSNHKDSFYRMTTGKSSEKKILTERGTSSKKFHKDSDIKVSPSINKLNEKSTCSESRVKFHQSPINPKYNSKEFFEQNLIHCKALDVHQRQYLTPNTSTYFQSLNNSIQIESQLESPQKAKSKNHKSHINIHNQQDYESKILSSHQNNTNRIQKHFNTKSISHILTQNPQNKYKIIKNENFSNNQKYKNIINLSNHLQK